MNVGSVDPQWAKLVDAFLRRFARRLPPKQVDMCAPWRGYS